MKGRLLRSKQRTGVVCSGLTASFLLVAQYSYSVLGPSITVDGFVPHHSQTWGLHRVRCRPTLKVSTDQRNHAPNDAQAEMSDEELLGQVPKSQLEDLCELYQLSREGSKEVLLKRLREYADNQAAADRERRIDRRTRVDEGTGQNSKERHEIVNGDPDDEMEEEFGFFFYQTPDCVNASSTNATAANGGLPGTPTTKPAYVSSESITAPPVPPIEPNENGERVVTVYSTKDQNDLTGVAASQPGQNMFSNNAMMSGSDTASSAPWDMADAPVKAEASSKELQGAKDNIAELVHALLAMTGAPAFREEFSEGLMPVLESGSALQSVTPEGFVGFDPAKVPPDILTVSSKALRAGRGEVLQEVLRDYELRAIGHDGMAGDDIENGGGHYREVSKVRAFLEGYRRAEVRRVARETATVLLDKLVTEGVEGLDFLLASMTRISDDTGEAGELSNSLVEYLNDAIRQQEKRVEQTVGSNSVPGDEILSIDISVDNSSQLWNVTTDGGQRVETLDPNDPLVQATLKKDVIEEMSLQSTRPSPKTGPEQLLLLLTLLRERVKTEATFSNDEKGRNLRMLAYCLHVRTKKERELIITKEIGQSIDRLDSFLELVASSIEYAESTAYQLQPSKRVPLNLKLLHAVHELASNIREKQAWKASGLPPQE